MIPHYLLPLQLSSPQNEQLLQLQTQLAAKLEQLGQLRPAMLQELTATMQEVLQTQVNFADYAATARDKQIHLHLTHDDPAILNLPWRLAVQSTPLLFLTKGKNSMGDLPIVAAANPPLKILVMIASPEDADYDARLNYEEEEEQIMQAFAPLFDLGQVEIDFTDDGSLDNLRDKLAANRYHILHFSGHGVYQDGTGYLLLEDAQTMYQQKVRAADFAQVFQEKPAHLPALVVLSSCQTAQGRLEQGMQSVADELLRKGLPAVVAMSVSVTDYFATFFASALYQNLAQREPLFRAFQRAIQATQTHERARFPQLPPSQWMIPQLLMAQRVEQPVDFSKSAAGLQYSAWKFVSGQVGLQAKKRDGYRFVGRRRDRKRIFWAWQQRSAVLLKGQGGVGKTAMAEYMLQRLVANDPKIHAFIFNEYSTSLNAVIESLKEFLEERDLDDLVFDAEDKYGDNVFKQFRWLFSQVKKQCTPLFIFDNLETFQSAPGKAIKEEHTEVKDLLEFFYKKKHPLILTCRYSVAECPDLPTIDLNQVGRNDFLKKALQLSLQSLPKKIRQQQLTHLVEERLTFREVTGWLHQTFGGNYRALEFFDELFAQRQDQLPAALKTLADFKIKYQNEQESTRQRMSKNLLFGELLALLSAEEKLTLWLLSHFQIPVLVTALQMQRADLDYKKLLLALRELTLLEQHTDVEQPRLQYFYVTPLVKDLVKDIISTDDKIVFSAERAGQYHQYFVDNVNDNSLNNLEEAFHFFTLTKNREQLNKIGITLCSFYLNTFQFHNVLYYGITTYYILKENTEWHILNRTGIAYNHLGKPNEAMQFYKLCLQKAITDKSPQNVITSWNNISQVFMLYGQYKQSMECLERTVEICEEIGDTDGMSSALNNIAGIYRENGENNKAMGYFLKALDITRNDENKVDEARILSNIGGVHLTQGDLDSALYSCLEALKIQKQINKKIDESSTRCVISQIYRRMGNNILALEHLSKAFDICSETDDVKGMAYIRSHIADLKKDDDLETYFQYKRISYYSLREIGDSYRQCIVGLILGIDLCKEGIKEEGLVILNECLEICQETKSQMTNSFVKAIELVENNY